MIVPDVVTLTYTVLRVNWSGANNFVVTFWVRSSTAT